LDHRQLAALACAQNSIVCRYCRRVIAGWPGRPRRRAVTPQPGDGAQQLAPMADRGDAEILQVIGGQVRQQHIGDVILAECRLVLLQAQALQPTADIHRRFLRSGDA
jgi:hypothetical protein